MLRLIRVAAPALGRDRWHSQLRRVLARALGRLRRTASRIRIAGILGTLRIAVALGRLVGAASGIRVARTAEAFGASLMDHLRQALLIVVRLLDAGLGVLVHLGDDGCLRSRAHAQTGGCSEQRQNFVPLLHVNLFRVWDGPRPIPLRELRSTP